MPGVQQEKLSPGGYRIRQVAPLSPDNIQPGVTMPTLSPGVVVLQQTLYAEFLPQSPLPNSPDLESGEEIMRLGDAGEFTLRFPNRDASDGQPWRSRFDPKQRLHWVEIYHEGDLEFVGVLADLNPDRQAVTLKGYDGWFCLKSAYEQDFVTVMGPRDFIERYTQLWTAVAVDDFSSSNTLLTSIWSGINSNVGGARGSSSGAVSGATSSQRACWQAGVHLFSNSLAGDQRYFGLQSQTSIAHAPNARWTISANITVNKLNLDPFAQAGLYIGLGSGGSFANIAALNVNNAGASLATGFSVTGSEISLSTGPGVGGGNPTGINTIGLATSSYAMTLECDGRWMRGFVNGQLVGYLPAPASGTYNFQCFITLNQFTSNAVSQSDLVVAVYNVKAELSAPFLLRGSDKGDYVLPGNASTYPVGGLHGRYYSDVHFAPDTLRVTKLLNPTLPSYFDRLDPTINWNATTFQPAGSVSTNYSVRWFGAIYLKLSAGNYTISFTNDDGVRVWIGKTAFGSQIIDDWATGGARTNTVTLTAASLAGTNSDGSTASKDGWYPIVIEYFQDSSTASAIFNFTPPATYTDPGGTSLTGGASVVVPATSLSPLGCVDQHVQGQSHFDLVQKTGVDFGYQLAIKPKSLESGEFPGRLAPRVREGRDWDEVVEVDDIDRKSGANNYANDLDATDNAASLKAFGSGIADGKGSQIAFEAIDATTIRSSLFDMQAWVDAGDISQSSLLQARAQTELGLRLSPWQNLSSDPIGRDRIADTFPLTGSLGQFSWRPGDGVIVWLPDVNVTDTSPRQMRQVTRQFVASGRTNCQVAFRSRPRDVAYSIREQLKKSVAALRNYNRQYVALQGVILNLVSVASGGSLDVSVPLQVGDQVVAAELFVNENSNNQELRLFIGGVDRTSTLSLGSGWTLVPVRANILGAIQIGTGNKILAALKNNGVSPTNVTAVIQCIVLR